MDPRGTVQQAAFMVMDIDAQQQVWISELSEHPRLDTIQGEIHEVERIMSEMERAFQYVHGSKEAIRHYGYTSGVGNDTLAETTYEIQGRNIRFSTPNYRSLFHRMHNVLDNQRQMNQVVGRRLAECLHRLNRDKRTLDGLEQRRSDLKRMNERETHMLEH